MSTAPGTVDPGVVWRVINGFTGYWIVVAAIRLGLFDALAPGPMTAVELAATRSGDVDRTTVLADALVAIGLLEIGGGAYRLTATAAELLVADGPRSMNDLVLWSPGPHENWPALDRTVLGEPPPFPIDHDPAPFYAHLVRATRPTQLAVGRAVLPQLDLPPGAAMLELGAGGAPWSTALFESDPSATATVNDLPGVIEESRRALDSFSDRSTFVEGDYLEVSLDTARFDVVVLAHVLRAEPVERARMLVRRAAGALTPGGRLVIAEYLGGRDPKAFAQPAMLAVTMMAATMAGRLCTEDSIAGWLDDASCKEIARLDPVMNTDLIVAAPAPLT
jgi:2-polyprenyl-3-methyl-5-hydroxy-6-metoxy-1,4-benzoquinol methylase